MHKRILFLFMIALIVSCSTTDKKPDTATVVPPNTDSRTTETTLPFSGVWVNEKYYDDIVKNRSPKKAQNIVENSGMLIPGKTLQPVMMIYGFHEGGNDFVLVKNSDTFQLYDKDLKGKISDISFLEPGKKINVGKDNYIRLQCKNEKDKNPLILEEILFSGKYSGANGVTVEFKPDGHVTGLDNYTSYSPVIDYTGPGMDVDQVALGDAHSTSDFFGFRFRADSLLISKLHCKERDPSSRECVVVENGEVVYRLKKN